MLNKNEVVPLELELSLVPGLPQIKFLGQPDASLRESEIRIKAALRKQGFDFPAGLELLVDIRPASLKKNGVGLELAVAFGFLRMTGQIQWDQAEPDFVYGGLTLGGEVFFPEEALEVSFDSRTTVLSASCPNRSYSMLVIKTLHELSAPARMSPQEKNTLSWVRPKPRHEFRFSEAQAELLSLIAAGEHSVLLFGPQGSGKTSLLSSLESLIVPQQILFDRDEYERLFGEKIYWRPFVQPHHSIPKMSMLGGGRSLWPGELVRAHGGILYLDEFLEFDSEVREALREPIEQGCYRLAREGKQKMFKCEFLLLASTNLCPCGRFLPDNSLRCRCGTRRRQDYLLKMMGPILDRFAIITSSSSWLSDKPSAVLNQKFSEGESERSSVGQVERSPLALSEVQERVLKAVKFKTERRGLVPNSRADLAVIEKTTTGFLLNQLRENTRLSQRRYQASLRVARTLADLDGAEKVEVKHIQTALQYTVQSYLELEGCT